MGTNAQRDQLLADFLISDKERAYRLLDMEPAEALKEINAAGYDFTLEEIQSFGDQLASWINTSSGGDELSEEALDNVAGGLVVTAGVLAAGVALFGAGLAGSIAIGVAVCNKKGW